MDIHSHNLPVKEYQHHYGRILADLYGSSRLSMVKKEFMKKKRELVIRLHKLVRITAYGQHFVDEDEWRRGYIQRMGYDYTFTHKTKDSPLDNFDFEYILGCIDLKFRNTQIHQIEVELAYINSNLKVINKVIKNKATKVNSSLKNTNEPL